MRERRCFTYWYQGESMLSFRGVKNTKMEELWGSQQYYNHRWNLGNWNYCEWMRLWKKHKDEITITNEYVKETRFHRYT